MLTIGTSYTSSRSLIYEEDQILYYLAVVSLLKSIFSLVTLENQLEILPCLYSSPIKIVLKILSEFTTVA